MKKLVIALTSVFAVGIIANSYAVNQYPEVKMGDNCRTQGITYSTDGSAKSGYTTTVNVPDKSSSNVNVQVTERSGQSTGYDTRSNNSSPKSHVSNENAHYNSYDYKSGENAKVNINCY